MNRTHQRPPRRLVLIGAIVAGFVATAILDSAAPGVPGAREARATFVAEARAQPATPPADKPAPAAPEAAPPASSGAGPQDRAVDAEITIDRGGVTVRKGAGSKGRSAEVTIDGHEFESFEQFVEQAPWLAGLVFMVTALVFLVPLVVIVLVIWYKVRRNRMVNETMLQLAERGVVPAGEAMEAIATGRPAPSLANVPPSAPLYERAQALRRRAAWSDLRKGVLIGGVGLGLTFWSMLDDGSANGFGLILLFVGIGYAILWYLEDRPERDSRNPVQPPSPPGGA